MSGLYIHIPFCVRKCLYCDFYSLETMKGPISGRLKAEPEDQNQFLDSLESEFGSAPPEFRPDTVFMGGGTPTELSLSDLRKLMSMIHRMADLSGVTEWTCESNPGTITREKAELLRESGVNRISLGVQSFNQRNLDFLGRIHSPGDVESGFRMLRETGFENINLDIIYGIPGSTASEVEDDIEKIVELGPEHVSCYCLMFEQGTPLTRMLNEGHIRRMADDDELEQYRMIRKLLHKSGYTHYEISNFSVPGMECRHNHLYWGDGEYLGFGPSAHSHWQGIRRGNVRSLKKYINALQNGDSIQEFSERLDPEAKARETLVMWLRRLDGVPRNKFAEHTGYDYRDLCSDQIDYFKENGVLEDRDGRLVLTEEGLFVSDAIFSELL